MKRKGFTLIELLVVIAIIALLMGILMPALARVRQLAQRVVCGTNLKGIGTAMMVYSNDDPSSRFPRAGGRGTLWAGTPDWKALTRTDAFSLNTAGGAGMASIEASFYILIKHNYTGTEQFLCRSDSIATEWVPPPDKPLPIIWDFGDDPGRCVSYSYHQPYCALALHTSSDPAMSIAADRNPWLDGASDTSGSDPGGNEQERKASNCEAHLKDGQNVLFVDIHVAFEPYAFCGLLDDNIYTIGPDRAGTPPKITPGDLPGNRWDSFVVNQYITP